MQRWLPGPGLRFNLRSVRWNQSGQAVLQPQLQGHAWGGLTKGVTADDVSRCDSTASHHESEAHAEATLEQESCMYKVTDVKAWAAVVPPVSIQTLFPGVCSRSFRKEGCLGFEGCSRNCYRDLTYQQFPALSLSCPRVYRTCLHRDVQ